MLAILTMLLVPTAAYAQPVADIGELTAFDGNAPKIFIAQAPEGASTTQFYEVIQNNSGGSTFEPAFSVDSLRVNAIAFNPDDRFVYAYVQRSTDVSTPAGSVVAIGQNGDYARIGTSTFLSAEGTTLLNAGDIDNDGIYYLHRSDTASRSVTIERVDIATGSSLGRTDLTASGTTGAPDFVWESGYLIGLGSDGRFVRFDPATSSIDYFPAPDSMPLGVYGGVWKYGSGNIGLSFNGGGIYRVKVDNIATTPTFTLINRIDGPGSFNNDATSIPAPPVDLGIVKTAAFVDASQNQIAYTVTVTNNGPGVSTGHSFSDPIGADFSGFTASDPACTIDARVLTCSSGPLQVGETRTYEFVGNLLTAEAGRCYVNVASVAGNELDANPANNVSAAQLCIDPDVRVSKSVDPASGTTVTEGQELEYTLVFENTGVSDAPVTYDDVLTDVLDDSFVVSAPVASSSVLTASSIENGRFTVNGTLAAGQTVTVSYTVEVNGDGERGNDQLDNFVVPAGATPPATCLDTDALCTSNPVSSLSVTKSSDPASGTAVADGKTVNYTLTFTHSSASANADAVSLDYTDSLGSVLDDADLTTEPMASASEITVVRSGDVIRITGDIPVGTSFTVTYAVTVKNYAEQGDHLLANFVTGTGDAPPSECVTENTLCTEHPTTAPAAAAPAAAEVTNAENRSGLPSTGAGVAGGIAAVILLLSAGLTLVLARRRASAV
ncbi:DUF11 domain-containing protein [Mycetocola zhadangensis]|uniref:DUF11 domain-containing protein n=1 Tax=Mycetocola zhadangensis TaxID=1164595 RepID=A0A3L7J165_9MICO|nr:DUF11 domain-containing protein [Mycetocola zhadangensis]